MKNCAYFTIFQLANSREGRLFKPGEQIPGPTEIEWGRYWGFQKKRKKNEPSSSASFHAISIIVLILQLMKLKLNLMSDGIQSIRL